MKVDSPEDSSERYFYRAEQAVNNNALETALKNYSLFIDSNVTNKELLKIAYTNRGLILIKSGTVKEGKENILKAIELGSEKAKEIYMSMTSGKKNERTTITEEILREDSKPQEVPMSKSKRDHLTQDGFDQLNAKLREMDENSRRTFREATEFKPGELAPEEEELVKREGLNALNYIPQKTHQRHSEAFQEYEEKMRKRAEVMSRPKTDPERVQIEREERAQNHRKRLNDRFDGFGYGMFLLVILAFTWLIIDSYGWPMGSFSGLLMLAVLELSYRFYARH